MHFYKLLYVSSLIGCVLGDWSTEEWDVIVVGAGPAGIIVASRMAEANLSTLLIESGSDSYGVTGGDLDARRPAWLDGTELSRVDVPGLYSSIYSDGGNLTCGSLINAYGACTIGGNSAINAGLFFEPPSSDWDTYFPAGWKSADMECAIERLYAKQPSTNNTSMDGVRYLQSSYDVVREWLVDGLGFAEVDINAEADDKTEVFGHPTYDYSHAQRGGPVISYLQEALQLPNFHLQSETRVVRVERNGSAATGVTVLLNGVETLIKVSETGRVILSAGAIQSPSLLMFSGIGDLETLTTLENAGKLSPNMPSSSWINSTSIGAGLFDNPNTFIELRSLSVTAYFYGYESPLAEDVDLYLQMRSGPYSFAGQTSVFWDTINNASFQGTIGSSGFADFTDNNTITLNIYGTSGLSSRGNVVLSPNSNGDYIPGPDSNVYYSSPDDGPAIAAFIYKIFQGLPPTLVPLNLAQDSTEEEIEQYITTFSAYARGEVNHWSSSCGIGSCVDANLTVVGMSNLHVVDASVVEPLTVNPQFGVMAAAERGAELILGMDELVI